MQRKGQSAYGFLMLSYSRVDNAAVKQDLGGVGDVIEDLESLLELLVVIVRKRLHPCLDFLYPVILSVPTCTQTDRYTFFNDNDIVPSLRARWDSPRTPVVDRPDSSVQPDQYGNARQAQGYSRQIGYLRRVTGILAKLQASGTGGLARWPKWSGDGDQTGRMCNVNGCWLGSIGGYSALHL